MGIVGMAVDCSRRIGSGLDFDARRNAAPMVASPSLHQPSHPLGSGRGSGVSGEVRAVSNHRNDRRTRGPTFPTCNKVPGYAINYDLLRILQGIMVKVE